MKINLKDMNRKELEKLQSDIVKALGRLANREKKLALAAAEKAAAAHGFSLSELAAETAPKAKAKKPKAQKASRPKAAPKYRNPADAKQTWSGKGRQPNWFKAAMDAGQKPEDLAI